MKALSKLLCVAAVLALAACGPKAGVTCPPLKTYTAEFQKAAVVEANRAMATSPHLMTLLADYGLTRNAIRACLRHK